MTNPPLRITLFGATGRIGRHVLREASRRGHRVTAFTRRPDQLAYVDGLEAVVQGDARDPRPVRTAIEGGDAVVAMINAANRKGPHPAEEAARVITRVMSDLGLRRLVFTSAYGMIAQRPRLLAPLVRLAFGPVFADAARMERVVSATDLDWTIARLTQVTNRAPKRKYRTSVDPFSRGPYSLTRPDAAAALLDIVADHSFAGLIVNVAGGAPLRQTPEASSLDTD
jgi:putative NADH-flavin reductase